MQLLTSPSTLIADLKEQVARSQALLQTLAQRQNFFWSKTTGLSNRETRRKCSRDRSGTFEATFLVNNFGNIVQNEVPPPPPPYPPSPATAPSSADPPDSNVTSAKRKLLQIATSAISRGTTGDVSASTLAAVSYDEWKGYLLQIREQYQLGLTANGVGERYRYAGEKGNRVVGGMLLHQTRKSDQTRLPFEVL